MLLQTAEKKRLKWLLYRFVYPPEQYALLLNHISADAEICWDIFEKERIVLPNERQGNPTITM